MKKIRDQQVDVKIENGRFIITAGIDLVCHAVMYGTEPSLSRTFKVKDPDKFADEIRIELEREEEDGTNLIHRAFDKAALEAIENGAEGVEEAQEVDA